MYFNNWLSVLLFIKSGISSMSPGKNMLSQILVITTTSSYCFINYIQPFKPSVKINYGKIVQYLWIKILSMRSTLEGLVSTANSSISSCLNLSFRKPPFNNKSILLLIIRWAILLDPTSFTCLSKLEARHGDTSLNE